MIGFRGEEVDAEIGGVAESTNFKGVARGDAFRDWRDIATIRGVEGKTFVVEPRDAVWVAQCAIEVVAGVVKARNEEVSQAIAFIGATGCGYTAKTIDPLRSVAGGPVHILVAKSHVAAVDDRVWAIGNDELKSIEFVAVKSVVAYINPIDINRCWRDFIKHLPVAIARIDIGPKWRYNGISCRRKGGSWKGRKWTREGNVSVVIDVNGVVGLAVQIKVEWDGYKTCWAVVVGLHGQSVGGIRCNVAVAGVGFVVSGGLYTRYRQLNRGIRFCINRS